MDMNFRWNRTPELGHAEAALAGATPAAGAANAPRGDFNYMLGQARDAQNATMAAQAQLASDPGYQRFKELEAERNAYLAKQKAFIENPKTQMAIGMALGGQPGALMSLIGEMNKGGNVAEYQSKMDELENDLLRSISLLGEYKPSDRRNFQQMMKVMYPSKFEELENMGAVSRMGGWPAWLAFLGATQDEVDAAKAEYKRKQNRDSRVRGHKK